MISMGLMRRWRAGSRPLVTRLLAGLVLAGAVNVPVGAQITAVPTDTAAAEVRVETILPASIPARADADEQFIAAVSRRAQDSDVGLRLEQSLAARSIGVKELAEQSTGSALSLLSVRRLESLRRNWQLHEREIARTRAELARALKTRSEDAAELASRRAVWQATRVAVSDSAPALVNRVDEVIAKTQRAEQALSGPLSKMLERGRTASALAAQAEAMSAAVNAKIEDHDRRLMVMDTPPLWQAAFDSEPLEPIGAGLRSNLRIERAFAADYDEANAKLLPALAMLTVGLLPLMFWLKRRARKMVADGLASARSMEVLSRPLAAWLVLVALGAVLYDMQGPIIRQQIVMLLAWVPVLVLLQKRILTLVGPWAYLSAVFYFLNVVASLFVGSLVVYRLGLLSLNLLMVLTLGWLALRARIAAPPEEAAEKEAAAPAMTGVLPRLLLLLACGVLLASAGANVLGNISLATMLTGAVLDTSYAALALYAGASVLVALFQVVLARPKVSRLTTRHAGSLIPMFARLGRTLLLLAWAAFALQEFRVYRPLSDLVIAVLDFRVPLGVLTITPGNVVAFVAATWVAFWLARTIRLLLAEDVMPALQLPRGVGQTVSTLSYYGILVIGLLSALAAAGFKVGELAIVFGALGVGIGLGLQDVVKNFVAGLILMFERPIQPGDVVDVVGVSATVRDIGLRATTLTTFDGADVVVPNGMLLSDKLVNWTLTGNSRRINIDVSTTYDVNPQQTIALLVGIAARLDGIAPFPAPFAIMTGLAPGELQFNVRAWTTQQADWVAVRSEFAMRIRDGLAEAGIKVPLPQRELHVRGGPLPQAEAPAPPAAPA
jgi:potassium-dependent mechanosensitive channel